MTYETNEICKISKTQFDKLCNEIYMQRKDNYSIAEVYLIAEFIKALSAKLFDNTYGGDENESGENVDKKDEGINNNNENAEKWRHFELTT